MALRCTYSGVEDIPVLDDQVWSELYGALRPSVLAWVYASGVSSWSGQEHDVADDILQEAVTRTLNYSRLAACGQSHPIQSVMYFSRAVAHNHFQDLRRREIRLLRLSIYNGADVFFFQFFGNDEEPEEIALERLTRSTILNSIAQIIVDFPPKQRTALLIDLAHLANFFDDTCPLQAAFRAVGINLHEYCQKTLPDRLERGRHAASLSIAYKRLKRVAQQQSQVLA